MNMGKLNEYLNPDWNDCQKVHDWKNYICDDLRAHWDNMAEATRVLVAHNAQQIADNEDWD